MKESNYVEYYNPGYCCSIFIENLSDYISEPPYRVIYNKGKASSIVLDYFLIKIFYGYPFTQKWVDVWFEYEKHNDAYMYIIVCFQGRDGKVHRNYLHRIIAATFNQYDYVRSVETWGKGVELVVDHIDGNTLNNEPYNLRYIPRYYNYLQAPAKCDVRAMLVIKEIMNENQDKEWLKTKK